MVQAWTKIVLTDQARAKSGWSGRPNAAQQAWAYSMQSDFLPYLKPWWRLAWKGNKERQEKWPFALSEIPSERSCWQHKPLTRSEAADAFPQLIEQLDDEDECLRSAAEFDLRQWTGKAFGHDWKDHQSNRPTREEGKKMQAAWRQWWKQAEKDFRAGAPKASP